MMLFSDQAGLFRVPVVSSGGTPGFVNHPSERLSRTQCVGWRGNAIHFKSIPKTGAISSRHRHCRHPPAGANFPLKPQFY
jgi:hypothetical protein